MMEQKRFFKKIYGARVAFDATVHITTENNVFASSINRAIVL